LLEQGATGLFPSAAWTRRAPFVFDLIGLIVEGIAVIIVVVMVTIIIIRIAPIPVAAAFVITAIIVVAVVMRVVMLRVVSMCWRPVRGVGEDTRRYGQRTDDGNQNR
ncbi:MAG: hypothetical protein ACREXY_04425, partial [Gammaproteobacteria bacterium]